MRRCRLEARLEANPPPRLTWTTAGRQIHPSGRHDIRYDNGIVVLLINNVQPQDAGEYQLRASNELGEVSCKTVLNIRRESNYYSATSLERQSVERIPPPRTLMSQNNVPVKQTLVESDEMQTLRAGCSKVEPKILAPTQTPFPGAPDGI